MSRQTYRDTLAYALAIAGSDRELAGQLSVTTRQLQDWLNGIDDIPERIFHGALEVITASSRRAIWRSRERLARKSALS
jgi:hypothetical protein